MLIGLDAIPLTEPKTGVGHHTFELARALAEAAPSDEFQLLYPSRYPPIAFDPNDAPLPSNLRTVRVPVGVLGRRWWAFGLPRHMRRVRFALFHGMNYEVPLWSNCPTVVTIHDLSLILHTDLHEARRVGRARRRLPLMARRAAAIITVSESVRREVCEHLAVAPEKVFTVHNAPRRCFQPAPRDETDAARRRLGVEPDFLLAVGTIEPRKNLLTLVRAFEDVARHQTAARRPAPQLVIAGRTGWLNDDFFAYVKTSGLAARILFTGYVSDEDLRALYSSCRAFIYPSTYEGFGLPPLEAMACGAPVVASRIPAIVETAGDAARLVAPDDTAALARTIIELLADENARRQLSSAGQARAARFTWTRAARGTLDVYREALGQG